MGLSYGLRQNLASCFNRHACWKYASIQLMHKADYQRELAVVEVERFDWLPLGAYLHVADKGATEVLVVDQLQVQTCTSPLSCALIDMPLR